MARPKISVLLTSYNAAPFLRESIDSVLRQTMTDFELVIADDCSTDNSWEIIQSYNDPRIRAVRSPKNRRTPFVFDMIQSLKGEYFALHHSDDIWMPGKLEKQVAFIEKNPRYAAVFTHVGGLDEQGNKLPLPIFNQENRTRHEWLRFFFFHANALCHPSVLMKTGYAKRLYTQYGPTLVNDYRNWVRVCLRDDIFVLQEELIQFRSYPASDSGVTSASKIQLELEFTKILECFLGLPSQEDWLRVFPEFEEFVIDGWCEPRYAFARLCLRQEHRPCCVHFGLHLLMNLLNEAETRVSLESAYGFTTVQMRVLARKYDVFSTTARNDHYTAALSIYANSGENDAPRQGAAAHMRIGYNSLGHYALSFNIQDAVAKCNTAAGIDALFYPSHDLLIQSRIASVAVRTAKGWRQCEFFPVNAEPQNKDGGPDIFYTELPLYKIVNLPSDACEVTISGYIAPLAVYEQSKLYFGCGWRVAALEQDFAQAQGELARWPTSRSEQLKRYFDYSRRIAELEQSFAQAQGELARWHASRSWRLTRPLRAAANRLRQGRNLARKVLRYKRAHGFPALARKLYATIFERGPVARMLAARGRGRAMRGFASGREGMIIVSHDARLGGATIVALRLARFLHQHYDFSLHFLIFQGGPKLDEFHELGDVHLLDIPYAYEGSLPKHVERAVADLAQSGVRRVVANTVISGALTKLFKQHGMAVISLVHEMPQLMRQMNLLANAEQLAVYSDAVIFGGSAVRNAFPFPEKLPSEKTFVLGQGVYHYTTPCSREEARARLRAQLGIPHDARIVLGCGQAEPRKGVDLFADVLTRLANGVQDVFFVWLGNIAAPADVAEIQRNLRGKQLAGRFILLDRFENDPSLYFCGSDIFFLSSREDPFPTVVLEAMQACLPSAAFSGTGGAEEMLGEGRGIVARHLDVEDMAEKLKIFLLCPDPGMVQRAYAYARDFTYERYASRILAIFRAVEPPDKELRRNAAAPEPMSYTHFLDKTFNLYKKYGARRFAVRILQEVLKFIPWQHHATPCLSFRIRKTIRKDATYLVEQGKLDSDFCGSLPGATSIKLASHYLAGWKLLNGARKPYPGFHPGMYAEDTFLPTAIDPFVHYLKNGCPEGRWNYPVLSVSSPCPKAFSPSKGAALHIHVYYLELLQEIFDAVRYNATIPDLFISVGLPEKQELVQRICMQNGLQAKAITAVPNKGRDLGAFLTAFGPAFVKDYAFVGHVHTKKSLDLDDPAQTERWRKFIIENTLGGEQSGAMMDTILACMETHKDLGAVFPDDPHVVGWAENFAFAEELAKKLPGMRLPKHFNFPVGSYFWMRTEVLTPLVACGFTWNDYPEEPLPYDGTMLHALERIVGLLPAYTGHTDLSTHVKGVTR